ncbi:hypothetical protein Drose_25575 [Dactylosporangium roseum]|uniref:Uncharacterized protein n=1 Tax=Dactylosporangium roseum TaxID=47989 RepID=A0ABY5YXT6_9ACTN|nr:hypothetical protein [Dactylosporangium roseum]UWZ34581.1 hypothetical protein Drose_25575 [Dactylosporangium roseum]
MEQAKRPVTGLAGPYGHRPHPALVAVPIGACRAYGPFAAATLVPALLTALGTGER